MSAVSSATSSVSGLGQNQFLQLLVDELKNQNPLNPTDETQSLSQLAQFSTLTAVQNLGSSFDQMLQLQQLSEGTNLVGKQVQYTDSSSNSQTGTVGSLSVSSTGSIVLSVGSNQVPLSNVTGVLS